jgi:putative ABC transport system permease protein
MRLAWHNITYDGIRFLVTVAGIACAVFLMLFQGSVLLGFLHASSKLIEATDSDLWITARGVACLEFPAPLERRTADLARSVEGVAGISRLCIGQVQCRKPDGNHQLLTLVGGEPTTGGSFPLPYLQGPSSPLAPEGLLVDGSNRELLNVTGYPIDVEVNRRRARIIGETQGYSTFLGTPYVFAGYSDAARYLGLGSDETMFILVRLAMSQPLETVRRHLQERLPNVDVWTREEFSRKSQMYWVTQTGAGGAIFMVAVLGFLVGLAIVSQAIYATTMENLEEYSTLRAIGASGGFITQVVVAQSLICGIFGFLLGFGASVPLIEAARSAVPWIHTPAWLPPLMIVPSLGMCLLASMLSVRRALWAEPARVFRA